MAEQSERFQGRGSYSFEESAKQVERFLEILRARDIPIENGGQLQRACVALLDLYYRRLNPGNDGPWDELRDDLQVAIGVGLLIRRLIECEGHPCFEQLLAHVRVLAATKRGSPSPAAHAPVTDDAANKIVELSLGVASCRISRDVQLDDPVHSSGGANPDVLFVSGSGERWGIACKAVHGDAHVAF